MLDLHYATRPHCRQLGKLPKRTRWFKGAAFQTAGPAGWPYPSPLGSGTTVDTASAVVATTDVLVSTLVPDPRVDTGSAVEEGV